MRKLIYLVFLLLLAGCYKPDGGMVIEKWYEEGHYYTTTNYIKVGDVKIPQTITHYDDPDWCVRIRFAKKNGKMKNKTVYVTEEEWNDIEIARYFKIKGDEVYSDSDYPMEEKKE